MPLPVEIFAALGALLLVQSLFSLQDGYRFRRFVRMSLARPPRDHRPPAAVIIPCKGVTPDLETNLGAFLAQDYPDYQVVLVVACEDDPARAPLAARLVADAADAGFSRRPRKATLVIAGRSDERGEKVNNLRQGLAAADAGAEVLVFADIDARARPDWLRSLVEPLADPSVTVSTGFRWYLPGRGLASQVRAAWDTSIATMLGEHNNNFAWGGSMAMRAGDFKRLRIADRYWAHTVSDDYSLARAVRDAGGRIRFEPRCLLASREQSTFREFLRWSNRQIILTRVYAPRLWAAGLASYALYGATFVLGMISMALPTSTATARAAAAISLLTILLLGIAKARLRTAVAREIFPEERAALHRYGARYWQLAPLVPWIMLFNFVAAGLTRRIEWSGVVYELPSPDEVRVLGREQWRT